MALLVVLPAFAECNGSFSRAAHSFFTSPASIFSSSYLHDVLQRQMQAAASACADTEAAATAAARSHAAIEHAQQQNASRQGQREPAEAGGGASHTA